MRFRACIVRVLSVYCCVFYLSGHTVYTAPFWRLHAGKHMLAASVVSGDHRK